MYKRVGSPGFQLACVTSPRSVPLGLGHVDQANSVLMWGMMDSKSVSDILNIEKNLDWFS